MSVARFARFEGGPCHGEETTLIGGLPSYLMMMRNPAQDSMAWIVVGAGFDDHWPGQHRYELDPSVGEASSGEAVYRYAGAAT